MKNPMKRLLELERCAALALMSLATLTCGASVAQGTHPPTAAAQAQRYTIAMVLPRENQNIETGFINYLQRQGVAVDYVSIRYSGRTGDAEELRRQVRAANPDLIYTWGTPTALALAGRFDKTDGQASAIRDIPTVFTEVTDPVGAGLIASVEKPQRNVTGVSHVAPLAAQLNTIRAYRPFKKLGYLDNPAEPNSQLILAQLKEMAKEQKFDIISVALPLLDGGKPDDSQIQASVAQIAQSGADILYIGPITYLAYTRRDEVTQAALDNKLPTFCATESIVRQSHCMVGLFSNGANVGAYAGSMAMQVLVKKKPVESIPASRLQRFSLLVNMQTASALQLYPPMLLLNVAEVINAPGANMGR